jgi:N-acetylmuramoyl-L-alanine amidase
MKGRARLCGWWGVMLWLTISAAEAGTLDVQFINQNLRYTLYTLYDGQAEYVHLHKIAEMFRLSVEVDAVDGRVVVKNDDQSASFFPGDGTVIANRRSYFLDIPPRKIEEVIMVPLQFLTEILPLVYEGDVVWDPGHRVLQVGVQNLEILRLYFSPYGEHTRLVADLNRKVAYKVTEKLPSLLIFELPRSDFTVSPNPLQVNSPSVQHVKVIDSFGTTQIIIKLGPEFERYQHALTEDPPRLIIDVYHTAEPVVEDAQAPDPTEGIEEEDITFEEAEQTTLITPRKFTLRTVVIDPGHGGSDPGVTVQASEAGAILEKDITLAIAQKLAVSLTQRLGVRVVLTREADSFVPPEERTTIANNNRADAFLSMHVNNAPTSALSGFEVYVMDYGSLELPEGFEAISAQSQVLDYAQARYVESSERLAQEITQAYQARNSGSRSVVRRAPLFTLKGATMPAVHIEIGYNSNQQDQVNILREEFQQLLVAAITDGVAAFKKAEEQ